tara:strand:+ start:6231 stop:8468 length:2238 start_codon:yes stop_codon:yes gene_type:complete
MSEKKIMVANLDTDAPIDLLLKDQGEWIRTDSGFNYTVNPSPIFNVSVETPLLPIAIGAPAIPVVYDITVTPKSLAISSEDKLILNSLPGNVYEDHITTLTTGLTFQEALDVGLDNFTDTLGVEFVYNFLDTEYENLLAPVSDHNVIPNINVVMSETESVFTEEENLLNSTTANMLEDNLEVSNTFGGLSNQIVANNEKAKEYESNKGLFPMYCQINIPSPPGEHIIGDAIGVAQAEHLIARDIHGATDTAPQTVVGDALAYSYMYYDSDGSKVVINADAFSKSVLLEEWILNDAPSWYAGLPLPDDWSFVASTEASRISTGDVTGTGLLVADVIAILEDQISFILNDKARTYQQLINGEQAYSESIMYKVVKHLGKGLDNPVQTFYFNKTGELVSEFGTDEKVSLVDTQVKYDQEYTYSAIAYQAIVGTRHSYGEFEFSTDEVINNFTGEAIEGDKATSRVTVTPFMKIVEMPLFEVTGKILSNPPLPPELGFVPYRGQTDKLLFHLNTNQGSQDMVPITLNSTEASDIDMIAVNQKRNDGLITFETDDNNKAYEIYRLTEPPIVYEDFNNNLIASVSTVGDGTTSLLEAGSANIVIQHTTNKKYYYMFRSIDVHGTPSNPSEVYEIELYNDGGAGYPIIRKFEFGSISPKMPSKEARKLIQIVPRMSQAYFNAEASGIDSTTNIGGKPEISLGLEDESLFAATSGYGVKTGKKFKIRLTSKFTGKKVDINIDFNTNRVESETD